MYPLYFQNLMDNKKKPLIIIISSPSGAGKTSVCKNLLKLDSNIKLSISVTTRTARDNEIDGKDYYFIDSNEFKRMLNNNELLEHAKVFNNYYGSPRSYIDDYLSKGNDVLFDIDWQGAQQIVNSNYARIINGIKNGDSVVVNSNNGLQDGQEVVIK